MGTTLVLIILLYQIYCAQLYSWQIESLQIAPYGMSESASQTLGASICAMSCVKEVKLIGKLSDGFYSALIKGASSLKVERFIHVMAWSTQETFSL